MNHKPPTLNPKPETLLSQGPSGGLVVQQILPGGPAATSGQIRQGDVLIDVDGHDVRSLLSFLIFVY